MKKLLLVFLIFAVAGASAFAFDPLSYPPPLGGGGGTLVDVGIGYWHTNYTDHYGSLSVPPLSVSVEYALPLTFPISLGGGFTLSQWKFGYPYDYTQLFVTPQARINWHWGFDVRWLDLYTGVSFGWIQVTTRLGSAYGGSFTPAGQSQLYWDPHVGAHFYLSDNLGAMIETGFTVLKESGFTFLVKGGLALKFGGRPASVRPASVRSARGMGTAAVTTDVNLRSGPSLDYPVIIALPQGAIVTLTGEIVEGWTQVIYNGATGWISSPYLNTRL